jgi:hypothetical protein
MAKVSVQRVYRRITPGPNSCTGEGDVPCLVLNETPPIQTPEIRRLMHFVPQYLPPHFPPAGADVVVVPDRKLAGGRARLASCNKLEMTANSCAFITIS